MLTSVSITVSIISIIIFFFLFLFLLPVFLLLFTVDNRGMPVCWRV